MSKSEVEQAVLVARAAQTKWARTSFSQRRDLLRLLNDYVVENQEAICRVAARDTGKTSMVLSPFLSVLFRFVSFPSSSASPAAGALMSLILFCPISFSIFFLVS